MVWPHEAPEVEQAWQAYLANMQTGADVANMPEAGGSDAGVFAVQAASPPSDPTPAQHPFGGDNRHRPTSANGDRNGQPARTGQPSGNSQPPGDAHVEERPEDVAAALLARDKRAIKEEVWTYVGSDGERTSSGKHPAKTLPSACLSLLTGNAGNRACCTWLLRQAHRPGCTAQRQAFGCRT